MLEFNFCMRKILIGILIFTATLSGATVYLVNKMQTDPSGAPPYGESEENAPNYGVLSWLADWKRPEGPAKVALQVGHWKNSEFPDELEKLRGNSGARGGGMAEWEVNLAIAQLTAGLLEEKGISVEILPATVPPSYWADVFLAIHADGSTDPSKRGFKVASPWRDFTGNADSLVKMLENTYQEVIGWEIDPNITRNMRGYYAFSWWKYEHTIHPMTTAAIFETGFLTNADDRKVLTGTPEIPARAIADGVIKYLVQEELIEK